MEVNGPYAEHSDVWLRPIGSLHVLVPYSLTHFAADVLDNLHDEGSIPYVLCNTDSVEVRVQIDADNSASVEAVDWPTAVLLAAAAVQEARDGE